MGVVKTLAPFFRLSSLLFICFACHTISLQSAEHYFYTAEEHAHEFLPFGTAYQAAEKAQLEEAAAAPSKL
jgi:hypothetical protein